MRYSWVYLLILLSSCLFQDGTVDIKLEWETRNHQFSTCRQAQVDLVEWYLVDDYGDTVKSSGSLVSCRDSLMKDLQQGDYNLEIYGYLYDYLTDRYYLEWETYCTDMRAMPDQVNRYTCQIRRVYGSKKYIEQLYL